MSRPANEAPAPARARPVTTVLVCVETEASAMMVPTKLLEYPRVALEPTCQNTLAALALFSRMKLV